MTRARILIVDDDPDIRRLLLATLERDEFDLLEAHDGETGLRLAEEAQPDLVVLDWKMPGQRGPEVLTQLKKRRPDLPVVFLTAESAPTHSALGAIFGADAFVPKPFSPLELVRVIEALLEARERANGGGGGEAA